MLARAIVAGASRADPQHGDRRRQPAPAHPLHLFLRRCRLALQQARARPGLRRDRRLQPHPRDPRRVGSLRRDAPIGHVRRARGARCRRASARAPTASAIDAVHRLHRLPGDHPEIETVLRPGELITAVELPPLPLRAQLDLSQGARPGELCLRAGLGRGCARGGGRSRQGRAARARRRRAQAVAGVEGRGGALSGQPASEAGFRAAAEAELAAAVPLPRQRVQDRARAADDRRGARRARQRRLEHEHRQRRKAGDAGVSSGCDGEGRRTRAGQLGARRRARSADSPPARP